MSRREGYVIDVPYPLHFYKEMQPTWLAWVLNTLGCTAPRLDMPYRYCELGCGAGISTLVAAACNPAGHFIGVDFNGEHIAAARQAAHTSGIRNVEFIEASFDTFATQAHEPFDFIVSHGVWSWLPPNAQIAVMRIVHERLKPQGLLYLQYMCFPGAARLIALQKVLHEVSLARQGSSEQSLRDGLTLLRGLADAGAGLFTENPEIEKELAALEKEHPGYLAHEFLTDHWRPQHSADVHRIISQVGVSVIGSANCFENMDRLSVPGNAQALIAGAASRSLQETLRDMARNQNQRQDLFQKQPRTLGSEHHLAALDAWRFTALSTLPCPGPVQFETPIGRIAGPGELFTPLIQSLQSGDQSFAELRRLPAFAGEPGLLLQTLNMLLWAGHAHPLRPDMQVEPAATAGLEAWITRQQLPLQLLPACGTAAMT